MSQGNTTLRFAFGIMGTLLISTPVPAQLIGAPATTGNAFPFTAEPGTRYQQVYDASNFPSAFDITSISFFCENCGRVSQGSFRLFLSTTSKPVDGLSPTLDLNVGPDNSFFAQFISNGEIPSGVLTFVGVPFHYDPTVGNLLLDILVHLRFEGISSGLFASRSAGDGGAPPGFSRAHDFAGGNPAFFAGYGLVTEFNRPEATTVPEPATIALFFIGVIVMALMQGLSRRLRGVDQQSSHRNG